MPGDMIRFSFRFEDRDRRHHNETNKRIPGSRRSVCCTCGSTYSNASNAIMSGDDRRNKASSLRSSFGIVPVTLPPVLSILLLLPLLSSHIANSYVIKNKFNKLRYVTLRDDAFCEAYQEFKDNNCLAKLTECSPLTDDQLLKMRQIMCGPRFNAEIQPPPHILPPPPPPPEGAPNGSVPIPLDPHFMLPHAADYPPPYFLDVHPAKPNSFPWLAAIYSPDRKFICTGALVAPKTVVTSAQCVAGQAPPGAGGGGGGAPPPEAPPSAKQEAAAPPPGAGGAPGGGFFVRFGRHHLNISNPYDKAYEYDVETIEVSQQFDRNTLENDFAILKLVSPVCNIPPIGLPKKDDWENGYYFGNQAPVVYAGWGLGLFQKPYLRSLTSHLMPKDVCASKFNWAREQLSGNHLCVSPPINVCVGGAGTPLVAYTPHRCVLVGLLSLGEHCNTPKLPLVFTKVSTFIDDIDRFVEEDIKSSNGTLADDCIPPPPYHHEQPYYYYPSHYPASTGYEHGAGGGGGHGYHAKDTHYQKETNDIGGYHHESHIPLAAQPIPADKYSAKIVVATEQKSV